MTFTPPAGLGPFAFPPPYGTRGIRLTNQTNAPQGCEPRLYSYHSVVNTHRGQSDLYVIVGRIGLRPLLIAVDKPTGRIRNQRELPMEGNAEGFYFSDTLPFSFYFLDGASLRRQNVVDGRPETVFTLDPKYGDDLWQAHSSADDTVHSATVRRRTSDGPYEVLGAVVYRHGEQKFYAAPGMDECHIDKSGRWLIIEDGHDNLILDLDARTVRVITNAQGALAHLDVGDGWMVGEDDSGSHWMLTHWTLSDLTKRMLVVGGDPWGNGAGHVAVRPGVALHSRNDTGELVRVSLTDDRLQRIAPGMIDGSDYDHQLRACLDPTGEYACWIAKVDGRFDAFLVRLPGGPIVVRPDPKPDPKPGGPTVPGSQDYPSEAEGGWWEQFEKEVEALYDEAGQRFPDSPAAFRWHGRTAFDIGAGMDKQQAKVKHLRELRKALGLTDPS